MNLEMFGGVTSCGPAERAPGSVRRDLPVGASQLPTNATTNFQLVFTLFLTLLARLSFSHCQKQRKLNVQTEKILFRMLVMSVAR